MSRTYALTTPTRRSKRLLQNGYYRVQSTDVMDFLDVSASDDDDRASVDSNMSRASHNSEQRCVLYKESPMRCPVFKHRKKQHSLSPVRHGHSSNEVQQLNETTISKTSQIHKFLSHKNVSSISAFNSKNNNAVVGSFPNSSVSAKSSTTIQHHTLQSEATTENEHYIDQQKSNNEVMHEEGGIGDHFNVPSFALKSSSSAKSHIKIQEQSADYTLSDEDFEEEMQKGGTAYDKPKRQWFLFLLHYINIIMSVVVNVIWKVGKHIYQGAVKLLIFDTWILSATVQIHMLPKKFFKLVALCLIFIVSILMLYFLLQLSVSFDDKIPVDSTQESVSVMPIMNRADVEGNYADVQASLRYLERSLKEIDQRVSEKHTTVLDTIQQIQKTSEQKSSTESVNHEELLSKIEDMIAKSIAIEIFKSNNIFQKKIELLQLELTLLRNNQSVSFQFLRKISDNVDNAKKSNEPHLSRLDDVEKQLMEMEKRIENLWNDHNTLKSSINGRAGNLTYLRQISNQQFISNFQAMLEDDDDQPINEKTTEERRRLYLMRIFITWIEKRGYVREDALLKMKREFTTNSSRLETYFNGALENSINELRQSFSSVSRTSTTTFNKQLSSPEITEDLIKRWIKEALDIYSADRTGKADFALESAGGSVVNTRCSETFQHKTALVSVLGIPIYYNINSPRSVIQSSIMPGECWAFKGSKGFIVISLSAKVRPTAFTLDHIPKSLSPNNNISSAPKDFSVYGLADSSEVDGRLLGTFRYNRDGDPIQLFPITDPAEDGYNFIELRVHSNWGHHLFTCLYRFRVHGISL